ncbi:DegT/DnrJ/EryC1/StrS family aminotransferase [Myxococcota bacterium]
MMTSSESHAVPKIVVPGFDIRLSDEDIATITKRTREIAAGRQWTTGTTALDFERTMETFTGAPHAVAVSNGGAALVCLLKALGLPRSSVVLCPTLTAPPTPHSILLSGHRVAFMDTILEHLGPSIEEVDRLTRRFGDQLSAIITVHLGGWISPKVEALRHYCEKRNLPLIEDCAHAHGSYLNGLHAGSFSGLAAFSFFMTKTLPAGEGGVATVRDSVIAERMRVIRNYGKDQFGRHVQEGFNFRISEFSAAVALWATKNGERIVAERRSLAEAYDFALKDVDALEIVQIPGCQCGYYKYIVRVRAPFDRDQVRHKLLHEHGIETAGGVYDTLCHEEPWFCTVPKRVLNVGDDFPLAARFARTQLCLPLFPGMTSEEQDAVVSALYQVFRN